VQGICNICILSAATNDIGLYRSWSQLIAILVPIFVAMATSSPPLDPHLIQDYYTAHPSPQPKRHLDRFSRFCTDDRRMSLYVAPPSKSLLSPQNCLFAWGTWTPANTWFPGPTGDLNPNGISIGAAVFGGLTSVTDRQTDRETERERQTTL